MLKKKSMLKIPKTVQQSIPYESVYPNGIIETAPGCFSKSYYFGDANFREEDMEKQENMFEAYGILLNKFHHNITSQVSIFNRSIDIDDVKNDILIKPKRDEFNELREEMNDVVLNKMAEGHNNIKKERYFTVCVNNTDIENAAKVFLTLDTEIEESFRKLNKTGAKPLTLAERLSILYEIYNINSPVTFEKKMAAYFKDGEFDLVKLNKHGFSTKDIIGPDGIIINTRENYVKLGNTYVRSIFLDNLPTFTNTNILTSITDMSCNMLTSICYRTLPQKKALSYIRRQLTNISAEMVKLQKDASKSGYSAELISPELRRSHSEAEALLSSITSGNQKIFFTTISFVLFAEDLETLNLRTKQLENRVGDFMCQSKTLVAQQMAGFNTTLPLATFSLGIDRILNTESASVFFPFSMQELMDGKGYYYGLNALSRNLIIYNRQNSDLPNGLVFGRSGSGKSMASKIEMLFTILNSDDDVIIIDPEGEYTEMAELLGGQVVYIANGTNTYINPLDMDINYAKNGKDQGDPVAMKCDFLTTICETIVGKNIGLTPYDINIIHRCGTKIYESYMEHLNSLKDQGITCDRNACPTLIEFYDVLSSQPEPEARKLAMSLELYCVGNYDIFAHKTNIDVNSRFLVYNVKNIVGAANKELAVQICLNDLWNRIIENKIHRNKRTWVYLDEFYLFTKTAKSVEMLQEYFKRSRKWDGVMTGITQDVEDVLITPEARGIFNNCGFLLMMNQSPIGRGELASLYQISPSLLNYITDKPPGMGLLYNGKSIIPFENKFPSDTKLYKIMTTKPSDK